MPYVAAFKSLVLLLCTLLFHKGINPPTPPPAQKNVVYKGQLFEYMCRGLIYYWQFLVASAAVFHVAVAIAIFHPSHQYGQAVFDSVCKNTDSSAGALSTLPPKFIIGLILMLSGSAVRLWCYHTLGRFFTFEVAIMDDHVLITSGPYAYVRHPAYTASVAMVLATVLMMLGPDSFVQVCKVQTTFTGWLAVWSFRIPAIYGCFALVKCTGVEDSRLKNHFGTQWANYAQRVPYRLIPYVM